MSDLSATFQATVDFVQQSEGEISLSNEQKLELYALYKQASAGDVSGKKPGAFDLVGKAKYGAWEKLQGMSQETAMQTYIDKIEAFKQA